MRDKGRKDDESLDTSPFGHVIINIKIFHIQTDQVK